MRDAGCGMRDTTRVFHARNSSPYSFPLICRLMEISGNGGIRLCLKKRIWIRAAQITAGFVRLHRLISTG